MAGMLRGWAKKVVERVTFNARYQQRYQDTLRVYLLTEMYSRVPRGLLGGAAGLRGRFQSFRVDGGEGGEGGGTGGGTAEKGEQGETAIGGELVLQMPDPNTVNKLSLRELERMSEDHLRRQVHRLFDAVVAMGGADVYPSAEYAASIRGTLQHREKKPSPPLSPSSLRLEEDKRDGDEEGGGKGRYEVREEDGETGVRQALSEEAVLERPIRHPDGFTLRIKRSGISHPSAGFGVHVEGVVLPGTVVAAYPGIGYFPRSVPREAVSGNDYLLGRYDGMVLDARGWGERSVEAREELRRWIEAGLQGSGRSLGAGMPQECLNPFGIASYVNHPPPGGDANVVWHAYDFSEANTPTPHRPYVPGRLHSPSDLFHPQSSPLLAVTVLFVTSRVVADEELLLDYRLNPKLPYPAWYSPCDLDEAHRRWSPQSIWFA